MAAAKQRASPPPKRFEPPSATELQQLAGAAVYDHSPYHKSDFKMGKPPKARGDDPSKCPPELDQKTAEQMLKQGLRARAITPPYLGSRKWPKHVYYAKEGEDGPEYYMAQLSNQEQGCYHGYPISEAECPAKFRPPEQYQEIQS